MLSWLSSNQNEMPCRGNVSAGQLLAGMGELKISFSAGNCRIMTIFVSLHELINTDYVMGTEECWENRRWLRLSTDSPVLESLSVGLSAVLPDPADVP